MHIAMLRDCPTLLTLTLVSRAARGTTARLETLATDTEGAARMVMVAIVSDLIRYSSSGLKQWLFAKSCCLYEQRA